MAGLLAAVTMFLAGCATESLPPAADNCKDGSDLIILREGDVVKITFPGSANLDTQQQIRRDGKITLPLVGEVEAVGLTPDGLKQKVVELYGTQIASKEVNVSLQTSTFPVFVNGSVIQIGRAHV